MIDITDYIKIFILGCERSGSTWLTNIFDAHPQVELFMEPFADYANIFPGFPGRNVYLSDGNPELIKLIKENFQKLPDLKYPLFYKPGKSIHYRRFDNWFVSGYELLGKSLKYGLPNKLYQYQLLNLNTSQIPISQQFRKEPPLVFLVTKELRLNFRVRLLSKVFPEAKFLIAVRHPGAQISSILKLFNKNHLGELRITLLSFYEIIRGCQRFEKYWTMIDDNTLLNDLEVDLIMWWLINYEVLIEDAQTENVDFKIVYHEEISEDPNEVVSQIFKFCGMNYDEQVKNYLRNSSSRQDRKISSPVDTVRDSSSYYKHIIKSVNKTLQNKIEDILSKHCNVEDLNRYYENFQKIT